MQRRSEEVQCLEKPDELMQACVPVYKPRQENETSLGIGQSVLPVSLLLAGLLRYQERAWMALIELNLSQHWRSKHLGRHNLNIYGAIGEVSSIQSISLKEQLFLL